MTLHLSKPPTTSATNAANSGRLALAGSVALLAGTSMFFAGLVTSRPEIAPGRAAYLTAAAANPLMTQISAVLLHYGNLLMGLGVLVSPWLVRGRRGSALTLIGSLLASVLLLNLSGSLFVDWMHLQLGLDLDPQQGAAISDRIYAHPLLEVAFGLSPFIAVGLVLALVGLIRSGVVGWWTIPAVIAGYAGMLLLPYAVPVLPALGSLPMLVTLGYLGVLTIRRVRAERTA